MIETVLFDLDGTLLPMDQDEFVNAYMELLAKKMAPQGYDPKHLIAAVWAGTKAMVENDGKKTNEEVFWEDFCHIFGPDARKDEPLFAEFYAADFAQARTVCRLAPEAAETIALLKEKGVKPVLATNPLFPAIATHSRLRWAGCELDDFAAVTTYEDTHYCKPDTRYFTELLQLMDAGKLSSATAMATSLAGFTGNPAIIKVVEIGIVAAWAYVESILDISFV